MGLYPPLQLERSWRSRPKPAIKGLSAMLLPFCPLSPHLLATPTSSAPSAPRPDEDGFILGRMRGFEGPSWTELGLPPRMEETEEWAQRACFRMADVTDIHSDMTRATGSTATATGLLRYCAIGWSAGSGLGLRAGFGFRFGFMAALILVVLAPGRDGSRWDKLAAARDPFASSGSVCRLRSAWDNASRLILRLPSQRGGDSRNPDTMCYILGSLTGE